jgi:hypothetical protein
MTFILMPDVQDTLTEISDFIDSINTQGAGERWVERFIIAIEKYAAPSNVTYSLCKDDYLALLNLSCFNHNDWIIAFKIEDGVFVVHELVRGSILF